MFINYLILAILSNIDSFGFGITYGLKKIKLHKTNKIIFFIISFIITLLFGIIGILLKNSFPINVCNFIGSSILICTGLFIIFQTNSKEVIFDFNNSNYIEKKELLLCIALSLDSICINIGGSTIGINIFIFSLLVAIFQYIFLSWSNSLGLNLTNFKFISQNTWRKISGIFLILIGLIEF